MNRRQRKRWSKENERLFDFMHLKWPYRRPRSAWVKSDRGKILALPDPHEPYINEIVMRHIEKYQRNAETVVVTGDLGDYYSKSRFRKRKHQKFEDELRAVFLRLEWLATRWKDVRVMIGNHDDRAEKHLYSLTGNETDMLIMTETNMLERLAQNFDNVEIVGHQVPGTKVGLTHIYQMGKIIFTHGELSLKQDSGILDRVEEHIDRWTEHLNLGPYTVLAQSHNHRDLRGTRGGITRMLLPTCSDPYGIGFEYIYGTRMIGNPPSVGYALFKVEDGEPNPNECRNIVFPVRRGRTEMIN